MKGGVRLREEEVRLLTPKVQDDDSIIKVTSIGVNRCSNIITST